MNCNIILKDADINYLTHQPKRGMKQTWFNFAGVASSLHLTSLTFPSLTPTQHHSTMSKQLLIKTEIHKNMQHKLVIWETKETLILCLENKFGFPKINYYKLSHLIKNTYKSNG